MDPKSKQSKRRDNVLSSLNVIIEGLNLAEKLSTIAPANAVFSTVNVILTMIRDSMTNEDEYVDLGFTCNTVCTALNRGLEGKRLCELSSSVLEAVGQLTTTLADIRSKVAERSKQNAVSRAFHAKSDSQTIASWRMDLNRILLVFNTELGLNIYGAVSEVRDDVTKAHTTVADTRAIVSEVQRDVGDTHTVVTDTYTMVSDIRRQILGNPEGAQTSTRGESPPPAPRACFGRDQLIEKIVGLAESLTPIALIGTGGIGKTSIALTALHNDRIKRRFGANRRFIRCDQFSVSCVDLLSRISKATGAGIENPEDLASLRPFLSSREILIVLDNAEPILDPEGPDAEEIYAVVEELSRVDNICLCITSRVSAVPPDCKTLDVPTLSIGAARDTFYRIYKNAERSDLTDNILDQLDFHPLSITLLATVAHQNKWGTDRLGREWERQRTRILQPMHNKSFAVTTELFLASPMLRDLPDARALLEVIAFFPQGVDENNLDWLLPITTPNVVDAFDKFCVLSLTYRSNSFITMLAPLRDHLRPRDPKSSLFLCQIKERYFTRMSADTDPGESRWITSEDVNVEYLLNVFTTVDPNSDSVWDACADFIRHLVHHKQRSTILRPKIEGLPDRHRSKPRCLFQLSRLFQSVGNQVERKRLLTYALKIWRKRGNDRAVARTLRRLSGASRLLDLHEEGTKQAEEASTIFKRLNDTAGQARCSMDLARLLYSDGRLDAAEEAASSAIGLLSEEGEQYHVCELHRLLGEIYRSKGDRERAVNHFEVALEMASSFNWLQQLFWVHCNLGRLFLDEGRFDDAQVHVERAKLHTLNHTHHLGHATRLQARLWYRQQRYEEARTEALRAADMYEKLGAAGDLEKCSGLLRRIEEEMTGSAIPDESADDEWATESK